MKEELADIVEAIENAADGRKCGLLIGAGCSVSSGIPLADGFVKRIEQDFRASYRKAEKKDYPHCMAKLRPGNRRDLVEKYIDKAKINWAHMCIAQLVKKGYVDRILTTNFDPLAVKACAMLNVYPAVYDFAAISGETRIPNMDKLVEGIE